MGSGVVASPFGIEPVEEVHLPRAPLVRVIAQLRFPREPKLGTEDGAALLRDALAGAYPILRDEQEIRVVITQQGAVEQPGSTLWRLQNRDASWQVTVSDSFVALDTSAYSTREDFCSKLEDVLAAISDIAAPLVYDRFGLRYVDRLTGPALMRRLPQLVRAELLGGWAVERPEGVQLVHSLSESLYRFDGAQLLARSGILPPGVVLEPTVAAVDELSWILDIDAATTEGADFDPAALGQLARGLADRAYRFFRWAVTEEFLREHGGQRP